MKDNLKAVCERFLLADRESLHFNINTASFLPQSSPCTLASHGLLLHLYDNDTLLPLQIKLRHADQEIRVAQDPFPLFPGEVLKQIVTQLKVVPANTALRLRAVLDFVEEGGSKRTAGDEWLFEGPG